MTSDASPLGHFLRDGSQGPCCVSSLLSDPIVPTLADGCPSYIRFENWMRHVVALPMLKIAYIRFLDGTLSFFYGLLTLRGRFLSIKVNLRAKEDMKLVGEEMLLKFWEMYADLFIRYGDASAKINMLENQSPLLVFGPLSKRVVHELCVVIQNWHMGYPKAANDFFQKNFMMFWPVNEASGSASTYLVK
ncbi:unnamed protein product [Lactuca saligna]|uniref:Uncharacterized protein n=1 Tax=Lactuca saligna TaxID=75948 RepID=A0AA35ZX81_LACSI|nr:unnamed protein product [Lactuca saligna]